jgi:hypothetical protein
MNALSLVQVSPASNPDTNIVNCTVGGNYVAGTPDPLPLNAIADPGAIGQVPMPGVAQNPPAVTPQVVNANCGGYYAQVVRTVAAGQTSFGLRWYGAEGAELASGAYPAAITGGEIFIAILVNTSQNT